jgi:succinate dehydrogenase / fumarate reductase cytochrome b subunit
MNRRARPVQYKKNDTQENSSFFSRTMIWSGSIVFVFLIIHLNDFFVEHRIFDEGGTMYEGVMEAFKMGWMVWLYVVAFILLGFHLGHGFASGFQTLGLNHKKYTPVIKFLGTAYSIIVPLAYAIIPLYFFYLKQ